VHDVVALLSVATARNVLGEDRDPVDTVDGRILAAAREVFINDPGAAVSAVASKAGVGISALYRRYPSKERCWRRCAL